MFLLPFNLKVNITEFDGAEVVTADEISHLITSNAALNCYSNRNPNNQLCCHYNIFNLSGVVLSRSNVANKQPVY